MTSSLSDFLLAWDLYRDPVVAGTVAGLVLGWLGVYVVLRRMVFVSAAVSQAAGLGVALSFFAGIHLGRAIDPTVGAGVLTLLSMTLFVARPERLHVTRESLLGLAYVFAAAAAMVTSRFISQEAHEIGGILFGSGVLVRRADLLLILGFGGGLLVVHIWLRRGMALASFDPDTARIQRLPVRLLDLVLFGSIGAMVSVSTRALGALPVFAFSVLPAMAALTLCRRLPTALALAAGIGAGSGAAGYLAAFFWDLPVGASQTLTATAVTVLSLGATALSRRVRRAAG